MYVCKDVNDLLNQISTNKNQVITITGSPGCGKTTLIHDIYRKIDTVYGKLLNTPTAIFPTSALNSGLENLYDPNITHVDLLEPKTIYSALNLLVGKDDFGESFLFQKNKNKKNKLGKVFNAYQRQFIIIDEVFQLSPYAIKALAIAVKENKYSTFIFIGDPYQLSENKTNHIIRTITDVHYELTTYYRSSLDWFPYYSNLLKNAIKQNISISTIQIDTSFEGVSEYLIADKKTKEKIFNFIKNKDYKLLSYHRLTRFHFMQWFLMNEHKKNHFHIGNVITIVKELKTYTFVISTIEFITYYGINYAKLNNKYSVPLDLKEFDSKYKKYKRQNNAHVCKKLNEISWFLEVDNIKTIHSTQGKEYDNVIVNLADIKSARQNQLALKLLRVGMTRSKNNIVILK